MPIDLNELERLLAEATPGPWSVEVETDASIDDEAEEGLSISIREIYRLLHDHEWADAEDWDRDMANADLIVAAVNTLPALITELRELREKSETLSKLLAASEEYRHAYRDGKLRLYAMGGEVCEAAAKHMPAGEGPLERAVHQVIGNIAWQQNASRMVDELRGILGDSAESLDDIVKGVRELRADRERLDWLEAEGDIGSIVIDEDLVGMGTRIVWNKFAPILDEAPPSSIRAAIDAARVHAKEAKGGDNA